MNEMRPDRSSGLPVPRVDREPPDSDTLRFGPTDRAPDTLPPPSWEPGVVEVQLREGVRPEIVAAGAEEAPAEIRSVEDVDLTELNQILRQYELQRAESTFQSSQEQASEAQAVAQRQGIEVPNLLSFVTLHFPEEANTEHIAAELDRLPEVERAVPVPRIIPPQTPLNEPFVGTTDQVVVDPATGAENQWYVFRCRANHAWGRSSGDGVVIADIDFGYRTTHEDLATRLDLNRAYNSFDGGTNVSHGTSTDHGTAVMGIAGAADNDRGIAGMAFGAILWPIQANSGPGTALGGDPWARAIWWVRDADSGGRRKVIILEGQTNSKGNIEQIPSVNTAIRYTIANGVVVCVAAGNGDRDAGIDDLGNAIPETGSILVGATAYHATENRRASFSNYGTRVAVCAPGDGAHDLTCSAFGDNYYRNQFGGTSGAAPKVAATAALMLSANPDLTHAQVRTILNRSGATVVTEAGKPVGTFLNSEAAVILAQWLTAVQAWELDGNNIVAGDFLGTRNSMPLEIRVNGILRLIIGTGDPIVSVLGNAWVRNGIETGPRVLAENFAYVEDPLDPRDLEPGDVVCMGPDEDSVVISEQRDDGLVLGVVSSKPGFLLNSALVGGAPMFPIALCGRVPCKVVDENGPIERGDLLATSSTSGRAMKASSVMSVDDPDDPGFKQVEFHRPGTILGKAVGSLQFGSGTGVIEVFVTAR